MKAFKPRPAKISTETIIMDGGYNENISSLEQGGGELIYGVNYYLLEGSGGGYQSVKGFERYDGQALASSVALGLLEDDTDREAQRDLILEVPGGGNILGIHIFNDKVYAFRNEVTDSYTDMYVESASGWTQVDLGEKVAFTTGATAELEVRESVTGGTSTNTAEILKVVVTSGTWAGGDAAGYIILNNKSGALQAETLTGGSSGGTVVIAADSVAQEITKDGKYHFQNYNFYATTGSEKMYFVNGVNKAMVFDGTAFDFIDNAGMDPDDTPINLVCHNDRLFLAYTGGSLQHSTIGDPEDWTTLPGEIGVGKEIRGLIQTLGNALVIFLDGGTRILKGTSDSDTWQLEEFSQESGSFEFTPSRIFNTIIYANNRGVTTLEAVQEYGDFKANTISQKIYKTFQQYKDQITACTVHRELNQYRLFFESGLGIVFSYRGTKFRGVTLLDYPVPVSVACTGVDSMGNNVSFFSGTGNGYVYKMDSGTSFDGAAIISRLLTAYYHYKSPMDWKKFISAMIEIACISDLVVSYKFYFDYNDPALPRAQGRTYDLEAGVDRWGEEDWGTLIWSAGNLTNRIRPYIHGTGSSLSVAFGVVSKFAEPHTVQNMTVAFEKLRRQL